jgi:hypothetical protein
MSYEIVSNIADVSSSSSCWLNNADLHISSNIFTTTVAANNEKSFKRKLTSENEENEGESRTTLAKN